MSLLLLCTTYSPYPGATISLVSLSISIAKNNPDAKTVVAHDSADDPSPAKSYSEQSVETRAESMAEF